MRNHQFGGLVPFVQIVDDLLTRTFHDVSGGQVMKFTTPGMNVADLEKELVLEVAAPGLEKKDFKIQVEDDMLVISADKKQETAEQNDRYSRKEFSFQSFKRAYRLPSNVDAGSITAQYENGILTIHVPKVIEINKNVKQIEVQ